MQVIYNVTMAVSQDVEQEWVDWMRKTHIPEVLATNMFTKAQFTKLMHEQSYAVQYYAKSMEDYQYYIDHFSGQLREKTAKKYGDKALAFRTLLEVIETWEK
jgi:hypothetical protein